MDVIKFDDGDVVVLKSGGPEMTVRRPLPGTISYECEWFQDGIHKTAYFNKHTLKKIR
jgi:uncharacterized protein YodC (DUF2158 family)